MMDVTKTTNTTRKPVDERDHSNAENTGRGQKAKPLKARRNHAMAEKLVEVQSYQGDKIAEKVKTQPIPPRSGRSRRSLDGPGEHSNSGRPLQRPDSHSDEFAYYVLNRGASQQLTPAHRAGLSNAITGNVIASQGSIVDHHTAAAIEFTLIDALFNSPTFQNTVVYGLNNNRSLGQIRFTNEYEINPVRGSEFDSVAEVFADDIRDSNANQVPLFASHEARETPTGTPVVNIGVAPILILLNTHGGKKR
ncbi:hypothetical protein CS022_06000 [Veronia nyctiphanis]|uniref:Uncharacterized protein n=1 Tax=Veronia nyctiphanis TaxID=1278244 RepID=A0A4Q0YSM9_9GAMM|nr:hypothetical protein CS022_06000 [Veronia nyctiphanis]